MQFKNIVVTGCAGFIGSVFVEMALKEWPEANITVVDMLTYAGTLDNLESSFYNPRVRFVYADITNLEAMSKLMSKGDCDLVVNFAAESHVDNSIKNPLKFMRTNALGTNVLLQVCKECGVKRFHQVSTDEVYGFLPLNEPDKKFTETSPINPSSPYSASKASADMMVLAYGKTFGLKVTVSRCSNNFGRNQHDEKMIPTIIRHALNDDKIPVYGDGSNVRDWIYVEDHCKAMMEIIEHGESGEVYNIGGHMELSNNELVRKILAIMGKPETLIEYVADRPAHDLRYAIDDSKLGWTVGRHDFTDALNETIKFYTKKYTENKK